MKPDITKAELKERRLEYKASQKRYYKWFFRLGPSMAAGGLLLALVASIFHNGWIVTVLAGLVFLVILANAGLVFVAFPIYMSKKYKAGYWIGPWADIPRKGFPK